MSYSCPTGFTLVGTSDCVIAPLNCPDGFTASVSGGICDTPPNYAGDKGTAGLDTNAIGVECVFDPKGSMSCFQCPSFPQYNGPNSDTSFTGGARCDISTDYLANNKPPWGHDSATPQLDGNGNILWPSIVSIALTVSTIPVGDSSIPCSPGTYMPVRGIQDPNVQNGNQTNQQGVCLTCPVGTYCDAGYSAPIPCPAGYKCPNSSTITLCSPGEVCPAGTITSSSMCPGGQYCPSTLQGSSSSLPCPAGFFCPIGSVSYVNNACNTGEYCPAGSDDHHLCAAGFYCPNPTQQLACPAGSYCPQGSSAAIPCPIGSYCPAGVSAAIACAAGQYCPVGSTTPQTCPAGFYCPDGATKLGCPAGTYSNATGKTAASDCTQCPPGFTCPYTGATGSFPMPNTAPKACALGYYCPAGSTTYAPCPDGFYCPSSQQSLPCPQGFVCPLGSTSYQTSPTTQQISSPGTESCHVVCSRGTGLPQDWNGAICVSVPGTNFMCVDVPGQAVSCWCQQSFGFGWVP